MLEVETAIVYHNLTGAELVQQALANEEGVKSSNGALCVTTGSRTGRSPKDRYLVRDALTDKTVDWGAINQPLSPHVFSELWQQASQHLAQRTHYVNNLQVGADDKNAVGVTTLTELAWHALFVQNLFVRSPSNLDMPQWTLLNTPTLKIDEKKAGIHSDSTVIINFSEKKVLLIGMRYAGEMKKAMFSVLNFLCPEKEILPMHCAANVDKQGDAALFFGLSGTGKTTLSADPERFLIGDDEHGWSKDGVFNFEGGCYAKCINLSRQNEPVIWHAIRQGAIMENVKLTSSGEPDFEDTSLTENTRAAYPREHIQLRVEENQAGHPSAVIFLTCDLYGVLPPVSLLSREQAAYYFLSGYTALVGSTEVGSAKGVSPTFSRCFGAPFFPRPAMEYAELLLKRIDETGAHVYLVNTGWTGGAYGKGGTRFSIPTTRRIISAIVKGELIDKPTRCTPVFNLRIPQMLEGIEASLLNPRDTWSDKEAFDQQAKELAQLFKENFKKFKGVSSINSAGPE